MKPSRVMSPDTNMKRQSEPEASAMRCLRQRLPLTACCDGTLGSTASVGFGSYWLGMVLGVALAMGCSSTRPAQQVAMSRWALEATPADRSAGKLSNDVAEHLAWAEAHRSRLLEVQGPRTVDNTLGPYNRMMMHLDAARSECELFARVHPDAQLREVAEIGEQKVSKYLTALKLDRELYEAFGDLDVSRADQSTQYLIFKILRDFRRAGVDKSEDVREEIAALNEQIVRIGQQFIKNISADVREIILDSPADLDGLPGDWVDKHPPDADGKIHVTTRYPDFYPFMTYARNAEARRALYGKFKNRGYPKNIDVLQQLLTRRYELAQLLGYHNWARYITEDKMIGSAVNARSFIERVTELARTAAQRDYDLLLDRKRQDSPGAAKVEDWEKNYYEQRVKTERYAFDAQSVRPYFNFPDVQRGLFELTGRLFGVTYRQVHGLDLWHEDVTAWDVFDGRECLGRFYLDLHPRDNKYGHAAQFDYRTGIAGLRLPQAALVCNFPNPRDNRDGLALMEHEEVVTFFHEFGHLLHSIFSGHRKWMGNSGISTEWDFVEAPSQILEEWCYDLEALQLFARHHETGETIPEELVGKLRKARDFGEGVNAAHQMFYAAVSLNYYDRDPTDLDTTVLMTELQEKYSPFDYVGDTHFQCSFGHLDQYSAIYYTYMWSLVIAKDLFSKFEQEGLLNTKTARRYREMILEPGGSKPAADLVQDFLGRPYSFDAFERWLNRS